jgi:Fe-S-cluster-containing dehydrogenase component
MSDRRTFLKLACAAGVAGAPRPALAAAARRAAPGAKAVLVDTTLCVGCRGCEAACAERNGLPEPALAGEPRALDHRRTTAPNVFTVVNRGERLGPDGTQRFAKTQCLHCVDPACASACPVRAFEKTAAGPVVYNAERCIGCRYCMVACPFEVPKYEYDKAVPYVRKCDFCASRQADGLEPACVAACPSGALVFGERQALLDEAKRRIYGEPGRYAKHVFGEHEAGGTSWLYIGDVPLESLGLRTDVGPEPASSLTATALSGVPFVMTLWPPVLMGLYAFAHRGQAGKEDEHV